MTDKPGHEVDAAARAPGAMLRRAREQRGMHIAALAAAIKVAPARLEALEADDYTSMPDTTFARALAQAVCRALKVDPAPVLALMPGAPQARLERVDEGLKAPFRDRPGRLVEAGDFAPWRYPVAWVALGLLVAAGAFLWWPRANPVADGPEPVPPGAEPLASAPVPTLAASTVAAAAPEASAMPASAGGGALAAASAPASVATAPPSTGAAVLPTGALAAPPASAPLPAAVAPGSEQLVLRAVQDTWVQVTDSTGKVLVARTLTAGETPSFSGNWPIKLRIGNVQGTEVLFRGRPVDLKALSRDNTATVTLPPAANP
jgi:cytoskeleton protein RodZ